MSAVAPAPQTISAAPTKRFFVSMLVRDIDLQDAILDLLDNCIDGASRQTAPANDPSKPFLGYAAAIEMKHDRFVIQDNCGGIPLRLFDKAFRMGRPIGEATEGSTVGMYGIGMKRAIFKLGDWCHVMSKSDDFGFSVEITPEWMNDPDDWELPVSELDHAQLPTPGTRVNVNRLRSDIAARFDQHRDNFVNDFIRELSAHYAIIIGKGFEVRVNGDLIEPNKFSLLVDDGVGETPNWISSSEGQNISVSQGRMQPYVFRGVIDQVEVEIYAGLYRPLPSSAEMEQEEEVRSSRDSAGWTIVCNDRVVVYNDKTRLTGWGEAGVPAFHGQFMAFAGVVIMKSEDPWNLPLTTTKRGIDTSSNLYSTVKDFMREATKAFTSFTNKWKRYPDERRELYRATPSLELNSLRTATARYEMTSLRKVEGAQKFVPNLPTPRHVDQNVRITYSKPRQEFRAVALALFETDEVEPRIVGEVTFENALAKSGRISS